MYPPILLIDDPLPHEIIEAHLLLVRSDLPIEID